MAAAFAITPFEAKTGTGSTFTKTRGAAVGAGSVLWCFTWQYHATNTCSGVSDDLNGAWTQAFGPVRGNSANNNATLYGFYRLNSAAGGSPTNGKVDATWSGSAAGGIVIGEVTGLAGGGALDQVIGALMVPGTVADLSLGTTGTLAQASEAAVAFAVLSSSPGDTPHSGWTADVAPDNVFYERALRQITTTTSALNPGWTVPGTFSGVSTGTMTFRGAGDALPPTLTTPVGTSTGTTTATVGATTDNGNGTMYAVVTTNATQPSIAQIKAGQNNGGTAASWSGNQAISSTGAKTFNATGLTASTTYYAHFVHTDAAANDSNRVSSASFTTGASSDTTPPVMVGTITVNPASTSASVVCPLASDNVAVTLYECSLNGGSTWPFSSATNTVLLNGLVANTTYTVHCRAIDASGNVSTPLLSSSFTTSLVVAAGIPIFIGIDPLTGHIIHIL